MANRLLEAKSLYLQKSAHQPVDWYEWSEEAFQKAREEDKPILLEDRWGRPGFKSLLLRISKLKKKGTGAKVYGKHIQTKTKLFFRVAHSTLCSTTMRSFSAFIP